MKIAIIGNGNIGQALATRWVSAHSVIFGVKQAKQLPASGPPQRAIADALAFAEIVAVAIPFKAWPEFANEFAGALRGKVVIDTTNTSVKRDGDIVRQVDESGKGTLAFVAALAPGALMVKAFNTMEAEVLARGSDNGPVRLAYPIAGDHAGAVELVAGLVRDAGFDAVIVGDAAAARRFDQGTPVWNQPASAGKLAQKLGVEVFGSSV